MTSPNTLAAAIQNAVLYQLMNIHTAFPAKIVTYDYTTRKATVQPMINKKYRDGTEQPMPQLNNVPVMMPNAGSFFLNFPVNAGDTCLIVCCERSIDVWLQTGGQFPPNDPRKFDLSDAVAIMGLNPFTVTNEASNNTDTVIGYNGSTITIRSNGDVVIKTSNKVAIGSQTTELLQVLSTLMTYLQGPAVSGVALGGPLNPAVIALLAPLQVQLDLLKGTI